MHRTPHAGEYGRPGAGARFGPRAQAGAAGSSVLEQQNDEAVERLSSKAGFLKEITLQINDEVRFQNQLLQDMHTDFGRSGLSLSHTMRRLGLLSRSQNGRWMCYLILFAVGCFMVLWLLVKSR